MFWKDVPVVQVDGRVALDRHQDRNLTHLRESFLQHAPLCPERIHAMPVESLDLPAAGTQYAVALQEIMGSPPVLDVVHIGLAGATSHRHRSELRILRTNRLSICRQSHNSRPHTMKTSAFIDFNA